MSGPYNTVGLDTSKTASTLYFTDQSKQMGSLGTHDVTPISHGYHYHHAHGGGISLFGLLLIIGVVLWALAAASPNGNPGMLVAGQVCLGIAFAPLILVVGCILWGMRAL